MVSQSASIAAMILVLGHVCGFHLAADEVENGVVVSPYREDDCGALCLFIALRSLDVPVSGVQELTQKLGTPPEGGYNLAQLATSAESFGMHIRAVETTTDNLARREGRFACIAHYAEGHFVNLINVERGQVHVIDAPRSMRLPIETFNSQWSRKALLISPHPILAEEDLPTEWNWSLVVSALVGLGLLFAVAFTWKRFRRRSVAQ
jgi:ABC-type bacteriocin/lantibiotic exporter with double-glycine peptidase domain